MNHSSYQPIPQSYYYQSEDMANNQRLLGQNAEIAEAIQELLNANNKLKRMLAKIGTKGDDPSFRNALEKQRTSAKDLTRRIMDLLKHHKGDKQVVSKLMNQFQSALKSYDEITKEIESKLSQVVAYSMSHKPSTVLDRESVTSIKGHNRISSKGRINEDEDKSNDNSNHSDKQQLLQQQQQQDYSFIEYNEEEILARKEEIQRIERDVIEVAEMFKDLDHLVNEQQVQINIIDDNIQTAKTHVESAHEELVGAESYQKSARRKKCCILFIFLAIALAIVIFGVVFFKK